MLTTNTKIIAKLLQTHCHSVDFFGVSIDSRNCDGMLFIAIKGKRFDGHDFISDAIKNGALAVISHKKISVSVPLIYVKDTIKALGIIAHYHKQQITPTTIAITGSNGKTTTKNMLYNILKQVAPTLKTEGSLNNHIGVPLTLLKLQKRHKFAVIEMGANHMGEIKYLRNITEPDIACAINTLDAHIGEFGSFANLVQAKGEIYHNSSTNIVNTATRFKGDLSFGDNGDVDNTYLHNIKLQLLGKHNEENALAAVTIAKKLAISDSIIKSGLESTKAAKGRLEVIKVNNCTIIDDSYNAAPSSTKYAIKILSERSGEKILVLGNIAEIGDKSNEIHAKIGEYAKTLDIDYYYSIGSVAKHYGFCHYDSADELVHKLKQHNKATILFKASRAAKLENSIESLINHLIGIK